MPLQLTFRGIDRSAALDAYVHERADKLATFYDRITSCRVAVERPHRHAKAGSPFRVRIDLSVPGEEIVVSRVPTDRPSAEDAYASIDRAFDEAARRLQDHVARMRPW